MQNPNTLYLHQYDLSALPHVLPCTLTDYEAEKYLRLPLAKKETYRLIRYILRDILKQHSIPSHHLHYSAKGKPQLNPPFSLSLSHSESVLLIAIMKTAAIGIDVQVPLPRNKSTLLTRFKLPSTTSDSAFLQHWTLTEAYCKCTEKPLLSTLSTPVKSHINNEDLFMITRSQPFTFSAVSTSDIKKIFFVPQKNILDG